MISNLNKNIDKRESSLGLKKSNPEKKNIRPEKSDNSLLFQYSLDQSELLKTPELLKSQISDNSLFKKNGISALKLNEESDLKGGNMLSELKPRVPAIPNFNQIVMNNSSSENGGALTFEDRFSKDSSSEQSSSSSDKSSNSCSSISYTDGGTSKSRRRS